MILDKLPIYFMVLNYEIITSYSELAFEED